MEDLLFCLLGFSCFDYVKLTAYLFGWSNRKPVKQEVSYTVILLLMVAESSVDLSFCIKQKEMRSLRSQLLLLMTSLLSSIYINKFMTE